jgi:hypothetical protein
MKAVAQVARCVFAQVVCTVVAQVVCTLGRKRKVVAQVVYTLGWNGQAPLKERMSMNLVTTQIT